MHCFNVPYTSVELQSRAVVNDNDIVAVNRIRWMKAKPIDVLSVRSARGQGVWNINNSGINMPDFYSYAMFLDIFCYIALCGNQDLWNMNNAEVNISNLYNYATIVERPSLICYIEIGIVWYRYCHCKCLYRFMQLLSRKYRKHGIQIMPQYKASTINKPFCTDDRVWNRNNCNYVTMRNT